jgi:hypothetical protein
MNERLQNIIDNMNPFKRKTAHITHLDTPHLQPEIIIEEELYPLGGQQVKWEYLGEVLQTKYRNLGLGPKDPPPGEELVG